jgi:hypothetical protein
MGLCRQAVSRLIIHNYLCEGEVTGTKIDKSCGGRGRGNAGVVQNGAGKVVPSKSLNSCSNCNTQGTTKRKRICRSWATHSSAKSAVIMRQRRVAGIYNTIVTIDGVRGGLVTVMIPL